MSLCVPDLTCDLVHENCVISTRITCLYRSQPLSVFFSGKTATFGPVQQVSMGPRHPLSFCTCKTAWLAPEILGSIRSSPHRCFCAFKTATLGWVLHVSMCPRPHLWFSAGKMAYLASDILVLMGSIPLLRFLDAKQRLLGQNNKSLWVPDISCRFVHAHQRD